MFKSRTGRAILALAPSVVLLYAYATGPEPRHTAAPGDDKLACTTSGCHNSFPLNVGGGRVEINFAGGQTYTPGVSQTFTIVITDPVARVDGFQLTARLESDLANGQAGDFTAGSQQLVLCDDGDVKRNGVCRSNAPIQFIEHSDPFRTNTITVSWTPPATNVGNVHLYIAANAANNDGNNTGDHIYTNDYVLTPAQAGAAPSITSAASAGDFNPNAGLASGTWLEIKGTDLSTATRSWEGRDFNGAKAPTSLDGVSVTVNGLPGYISYISPTQVNVQAPDDPTVGPGIQIQVSNAGGKSNVITLPKAGIAPALLGHPAFKVGGTQYVVAQFADQTFVGRTGLIAGLNFRPAKPGEVITIYAVGCGPVTPPTPAGTIASGVTSLQNPPTFKFGSATATLQYFGLVAGLVGLYQFNIVVPNVPAGDVALTADSGGVSANPGLFITIGQ
jgi:uncharacterized protein (TIGR03437 family)